ncbi:erythromycin esterase family protein [Flavobacterium lindanitolerans]|nr:erythromycin esterase family protein [Flavobacterium lindanitolerans]
MAVPGDKASLIKNFRHFLWRTTEVADLLEWMRNYNQGKPGRHRYDFME